MPPQILGDESASEVGDLQHDASKVQRTKKAQDQLNGELDDETEKVDGKQGRALDEESDSEDNSGDGDEDVYQVEAIRKHKFQGKTLLYEIKWLGYEDEDNTWEPEENLLPDAREILTAYHTKVGGRPQLQRKKSRPIPSLQRQPSTEESPAPKRQKRVDNDDEVPGQWLPKRQDWESEVDKVDTVVPTADGALMVYLSFKNGKKTKVTMDQVYRHCPRPMLKFYEAHLRFK